MANRDTRVGLHSFALVLACLGVFASAAAQTATLGQSLVVVNRREASRLIATQEPPEYPAVARINYIQGRVSLRLLVSEAGRVIQAHVLDGNPILAAAALRAVRRWTYHPLVNASRPEAFLTTVDVKFTLHSRKIDSLPYNAEEDLLRQVKPPAVLGRQADPASRYSVRMRLLLDDQGRVLDSEPLNGPSKVFEEAKKAIERWTFRPARWGTLGVPWYLEVDVPVDDPALHTAVSTPSGG